MADRSLINSAMGGWQPGSAGVAIQSAMGAGQPDGVTPTPDPIPVAVYTVTSTQRQTIEGIAAEIQSDSIEGDGGGIQNTNTTSVPLGFAASERTRFAREFMKVGANRVRNLRTAHGLYYRGMTADARRWVERLPGQNAAIRSLWTNSGVTGAYVPWSPPPFRKRLTINGTDTRGSTYPLPDINDPAAVNTYMRTLLQGGSLDHPDKATDPTGYAAWMEDFANDEIANMEYYHVNCLPITSYCYQNEPNEGPVQFAVQTYPKCHWTNQQAYDFLKVMVPKIRANAVLSQMPDGSPNRIFIYMDAHEGQIGRGSALVRADAALLAEIDGWAWHKIGETSRDANWTYDNRTTLLANAMGKPVFYDECEDFDAQVNELSQSYRFANHAMQPLNAFIYIQSPIWYPIHIAKNSNGPALEREGRAWASWRPTGAGAAPENPSLLEGQFTPVPVNWHAWKPFIRFVEAGSKMVDVSQTEAFQTEFRVGAWTRPNGKLVVAIVNRSNAPITRTIDVGARTMYGYRYNLGDTDVAVGNKTGVMEVTVPAYTAEFWAQDVTGVLKITGTPPSAQVNVPYDWTPTIIGAQGPTTVTLTGSLPAGLTLNSSTGRISGTPTAEATVSGFILTVTDSVDQASTVPSAFTVTADFSQWSPMTTAAVTNYADPNDNSVVFSDTAGTTQAVSGDAGTAGKVGRIVALKGGAVFTGATAPPSYVTDGGRKVIKFIRANSTRLLSQSAAMVNQFKGTNKPFALVSLLRRGTPSVSVSPFSAYAAVGDIQSIRLLIGGGNTVGAIRLATGAAQQQATSTAAPLNADAWYVVTWVFTGSRLICRVDGVQVLDAAHSSLAMPNIDFTALGAHYEAGGTAGYTATFFDGAHDAFMTLDVNSVTSDVLAAEKFLGNLRGKQI